MKTGLLITAVTVWLIPGLVAQIPNPGFENWQNVNGWYENPVGWKTNNFQISTPVVRDSVPYQGSYAMKVRTMGVAWTKFYSGVSPQSVKMYVRAGITAGDTAAIFYIASKNGNTVGAKYLFITSSISTWSLVTLTVTTSVQADSMEIYVAGGGEQGTTLSVDDVSAPGSLTALTDPEKEICGLRIYPNPMVSESVVEFCPVENPATERPTEIMVYDALGALVQVRHPTSPTQILTRETLCRGLYLVVARRGTIQLPPVKLLVCD